jgi:hypothetical protein
MREIGRPKNLCPANTDEEQDTQAYSLSYKWQKERAYY